MYFVAVSEHPPVPGYAFPDDSGRIARYGAACLLVLTGNNGIGAHYAFRWDYSALQYASPSPYPHSIPNYDIPGAIDPLTGFSIQHGMPVASPQMDKFGKHTVPANIDTGIFIRQQVSVFDGGFVTYPYMLIPVVPQVYFSRVVQAIFTDFHGLVIAINANLAVRHHGPPTNCQRITRPFYLQVDFLHAQPFRKAHLQRIARLYIDLVAMNQVMDG